GKTKEAYRLHYKLQDGMDLIFKEGNPAGIKSIFEHLGLANAVVRLPLVEASAALKTELSSFISPLVKIPA
ncbi:MAG: dihydrodipicolinate synthase family protein, partial [Aurantibacter sp.]